MGKAVKPSFKVVAAVLAGGSGSRMGIKTLKQFLSLGKKTIIQTSIQAFKSSGLVDHIVVALPRGTLPHYEKEIRSYRFGKFVSVIEGGLTRQESSYSTLQYIEKLGGTEIVLIHDAARPFVTKVMIEQSIELARRHGASEVAAPSVDTLIESDGTFIRSILDRSRIFRVQTPQTFQFNLILKAHQKALSENCFSATDDAQLILKMGRKVALVEGSQENLKITTPVDYEVAKRMKIKN